MSESHGHSPTERVWSEFHGKLARFLARRLPVLADVDDVLQTVFLNFHRHFGEGRGPDAPGAWLYRAAHNAVLDRYQSRRRQRVEAVGSTDTLDELAPRPTSPSSENERLTETPMSGCVRPLLTQLPSTYQDALKLTELDGLTQVEAANRLGVSLPGMKARVQRGRRKLKDAILACCDVTLDRRGGLMSARRRANGVSPCGTGGRDTAPQPLHLIRKR